MRKRCRKSGKIKFKTHEQAAKRAGEILVSGVSDLHFLRVYECPDCGKYHLTKKPYHG